MAGTDADLSLDPFGFFVDPIVKAMFDGWCMHMAASSAKPASEQEWAPDTQECDSPELCQVNRACAGQYGSMRTCPTATCAQALAADQELTKRLRKALFAQEFYRRRCDLLQSWQSTMRDPERTIVCDILANGQILEGPDGLPNAARYGQLALQWQADRQQEEDKK